MTHPLSEPLVESVIVVECFAANGVWFGVVETQGDNRSWKTGSKKSLIDCVTASYRAWPGIHVAVQLVPMRASKAIERGCEWL